jgi:hypothetical protein
MTEPDLPQQSNFDPDPAHQAEETLRLVARLDPPQDLNARVHARVRHQLAIDTTTAGHRGFWYLWRPAQRLQFAAAAVLFIGIGASMWSAYRGHPQSTGNSIPTPPAVQIAAPQTTPANTFGSAQASRRPATLNPIKVPPPAKKKPAASKAAKPSPSTPATQPPATNPR